METRKAHRRQADDNYALSASWPEMIPRAQGLDSTLALLNEGYRFLPRRFEALESPIFRTRLMLQDVICLTGPEAARFIYEDPRLTRVGALPSTVLWLLQDKGSVQQLDASAHRHRKAMFIRMLVDDTTGIERMAAIFRRRLLDRIPSWTWRKEISLQSEMELALFQTALDWTQTPIDPDSVSDDAALMADMVIRAGHFGPRTLTTLLRRSHLEKRLRRVFSDIRSGRIALMPGSPMAIIANHRDKHGHLLSPEVATVELINLLRPIVAVGRFIVFAALYLHQHPDWRERLQGGRTSDLLADFVEEVRRISPFFPFVGARTQTELEWKGYRMTKGQWLILDLYGTCHGGDNFEKPGQFLPERRLRHDPSDYSFIPQGAGAYATGHRCPGEQATVALMKEAVDVLCRVIDYEVPIQTLTVSLRHVPAAPRDGFRINQIRWQDEV